MITKEEKERIKSIIGHRYTPAVQRELTKSKKFNKDGEPYSRSQITNVMNGEAHEVIEEAIYKIVARKQVAISKRKNLLKSA